MDRTLAGIAESAGAKTVTSWPRRISSRARRPTINSTDPDFAGGTAVRWVETRAMRISDALDRPRADGHGKPRVVVIKFGSTEFVVHQTSDLAGGGQRVPVGPDAHIPGPEDTAQQNVQSLRGKAPELVILLATHADVRGGHEQDAARLQHAVKLRHRSLNLNDDVQDEGADDAVEPVAGNVIGLGEIGDDGGEGVRVIDMQEVDLVDGRLSEACRVPVRAELQAVTADVGGVVLQKLLGVVAADGQA